MKRQNWREGGDCKGGGGAGGGVGVLSGCSGGARLSGLK